MQPAEQLGEAAEPFPVNPEHCAKGKRYYIESCEQGNVVAIDGKVATNDWPGLHTGVRAFFTFCRTFHSARLTPL